MAVALEGFSIREYAAKMRSVDFEKCWPFEGDGGEKRRSLPPMSLKKFKWWGDEILPAEQPQNPDKIEADELTAEAEASPAKAKGKQRTPKKRSIVELFAVAPPVETVDAEEEDEEEEEESLRKDEVKEDDDHPKISKKKIMKKKKKKLKVEICAAKKGKISKPKFPAAVHIFHKIQDSVHKKLSRKASKIPIDSSRKKPTCMKNQPKKSNFKLLQPSKLISKNRREAGKLLPLNSILKNPSRSAVKKASSKGNRQGGSLIKFCCESAKHVTFSGKDDILGHNNSCSSLELPQLQRLCKIFSDVLAASSALDNSCKNSKPSAGGDGVQMENTTNLNVDPNASETGNRSLSDKKQSSDPHRPTINSMTYLSNLNCPNTEKTSRPVSVDLNHTMHSCNDLSFKPATSPSDSNSGDTRVLDSIQNDGLDSHSDVHVEEALPTISDAQYLPTPSANCISRSDAMESLVIVRNSSPPNSTSRLEMSMNGNLRQPQPPTEPKMDFCCRIHEFQPMCHLPSKDLKESMCSSLGSRLLSHPAPTCNDKCASEDFVGLPLNSQGEFIQLDSGTKFGYTELCKKQNAVHGSIHTFPVPRYPEPRNNVDHGKIMKGNFSCAAFNQKDQSNWFQERYCPVNRSVTSGFGFTNLRGSERLEVESVESRKDKDQFFHCDTNPMNFFCHGCTEDNHTHNYIDKVKFQSEGNLNHVAQPAIQQTMRLMGKNLTIGKGKKECQGFDDGRIWTDKEVITDNCSSVRVPDKLLPKQWSQQEWTACAAPGPSKGNLYKPLEASLSYCHMPATEPRPGFSNFDYRPQWMPQNGVSSTTGNHVSKVNRFSQPLPPQALLNKTSKSMVGSNTGMVGSNTGTAFAKMGHQLPAMASDPTNLYQHMLLSSTYCKHSQGVAYSTSSTIHPSFLYQDLETSTQQSPAFSSPNLPQWLLNAKQQKKSQESSSPFYSDPVAAPNPNRFSGTNPFTIPSPYSTSFIPFPVYTANTSQRYGPSAPTVVQPSFISPFPSSKSRPTVDTTCRTKNKNKEGTNFKFTYLKGLDNAGKKRKRPAAKDDGFMKPTKKPNLKMQGEINASVGATGREQIHRYTQYNDKTIDVDLPLMVDGNEAFNTLSGCSSLKFDGGPRPGPVKLSAGAKHILKPSQGMDEDKSRPIHSTIPFPTGNNSGKVTVPQKKTAKVYRF